jgi:dTDP-4-dehydrorhamnose reductase
MKKIIKKEWVFNNQGGEKMQTVLVIGAKGMLGQELVKVLRKDKKYQVLAWDKDEIDITKKEQTAKKLLDLKPDIVINAAAYNAVDACEKDSKERKLAMELNGKAPGYLAETAKRIGAIFVHYSTDYVFDGQKKPVVSGKCAHCQKACGQKIAMQHYRYLENDKPRPISVYGRSKLTGERAVEKIRGKYYIIRLSKLFGKPAKTSGGKRSFFDVMLELGKKNSEVKVVDEEISCFTYAPDLAKKTKEIIEAEKPYGIYHVVNNGACTWFKAVLELYQLAKIKAKVIPVKVGEFPRPAKRPAMSILATEKTFPMRDYRLALEDYLRSIKKKNK